MAIHELRRTQILDSLGTIFKGIPTGLGRSAHLQVVINRIKLMSNSAEEFQYATTALAVLVRQTKNKTVEVTYKGKGLTTKDVDNYFKNKVHFKREDVDDTFANPEKLKENNIKELKKHYEPRIAEIKKLSEEELDAIRASRSN